MIFAIDPGTTHSAYVIFDDGKILQKRIVENKTLCKEISYGIYDDCEMMYIEMVASYGMAVGKTVFETCVWIGRFIGTWETGKADDWEYVYRKDVKMHLCGQTKAKDSNIRQAIMDMYGSERSIAIGTKKAQGPLYGVSKDIWAALGVAITATGYKA
jgi:hypothetical protein